MLLHLIQWVYIYIYIYRHTHTHTNTHICNLVVTNTIFNYQIYKVSSFSLTFPLPQQLYIIYTFSPSPTDFKHIYIYIYSLFTSFKTNKLSICDGKFQLSIHVRFLYLLHIKGTPLSLSLSLSHLDFSMVGPGKSMVWHVVHAQIGTKITLLSTSNAMSLTPMKLKPNFPNSPMWPTFSMSPRLVSPLRPKIVKPTVLCSATCYMQWSPMCQISNTSVSK